MRSLLTQLKPGALPVMFFVLLVAWQFFCATTYTATCSLGGEAPDSSRVAFGIGAPVEVTTVHGKRAVDVHGFALVLNLAACYLAAAALAVIFRKATRARKPVRLCLGVVLAVVVLSFLAAVIVSRCYWGYFLFRPGLLSEARDIEDVHAIVPFRSEWDAGDYRLLVNTNFSMQESIAYGRKTPYYCLHQRILLHLAERQQLKEPTYRFELLAELRDAFNASGKLAHDTEGYNHREWLRGVLVDAVGRDGKSIVFVGMTGGQVSNDHYPYYELVFRRVRQGAGFTFVRGRRFFYDVAGIEGAEWYAIWPFFALIGVALSLPVAAVSVGIHKWVRRKR